MEKLKINWKKYLLYVSIVIVVIAIILLVLLLPRSPKKSVKKFVNGMNKRKAEKIISSVDFIGMKAWGYYYDEENFSKSDYDKFIKEYDKISKNKNEKDLIEDKEFLEKHILDFFDNNEEYTIKIKKINNVQELGEKLYAINLDISEQKNKNENEKTKSLTFVVSNNGVIYAGGIGF